MREERGVPRDLGVGERTAKGPAAKAGHERAALGDSVSGAGHGNARERSSVGRDLLRQFLRGQLVILPELRSDTQLRSAVAKRARGGVLQKGCGQTWRLAQAQQILSGALPLFVAETSKARRR